MPLIALLNQDIPSPAGTLRLRPETAADEEFRFCLFCESRPEFALLPAAMRETVSRQQFRAQTAGYAAQFPGASLLIVEQDGTPIGRLAVAGTAEHLHLIDIAVIPPLRGSGAGSALLLALMRQTSILRLHVVKTNAGALRLYLRLGFLPVAEDAAHIEMEWRAPGG
jgi:ribosomal protein S18 acetylase RimI-like enzyme